MNKIGLMSGELLQDLDDNHKKYGPLAKATDLYVLQGGHVHKNNGDYWTNTPTYNGEIIIFVVSNFNTSGEMNYTPANDVRGVRPVMSLSKIYDFKRKKKKANGVEEIEYGEYPQNIVDEKTEEKLENLYQNNKLSKTTKKYTSKLTTGTEIYQEYTYKNKKYIRIIGNITKYYNDQILSNGREAIKGKAYWVEIEPIKWIVDEEEGLAISKKILTNMQFSYNDNCKYNQSDIKEFLEKYFIKEIKETNKNIDLEKIDTLIDLTTMLYGNKEEQEKIKKKVR